MYRIAVIWLNLFLELCNSYTRHEWHPGIPKYFLFENHSLAVHVRVNNQGSKVFADPSMSFVNTMSTQHQHRSDSYGRSSSDGNGRSSDAHGRSSVGNRYIHVRRGKKLNDSNVLGSVRNNSFKKHLIRILPRTNSKLNSKFNSSDISGDRKRAFFNINSRMIPNSKVKTHRRRKIEAVAKRQHITQRNYLTNRNTVSVTQNDRCVYKRHTKDPSAGKNVENTVNRNENTKKSKLKNRCRKHSELLRRNENKRKRKRTRIPELLRRSVNRLFNIKKAKNSQAKHPTKGDAIEDTAMSSDGSGLSKPSKDFTSTGWNLDAAASKTGTEKAGKEERNKKEEEFGKKLPNIEELNKVAEINLNPFAHAVEEEHSPPTPYFNDSMTRLSVDSDSVIQKFLQNHEKQANTSTPEHVHHFINETNEDTNSAGKSSIKSHKLKDTEIKNIEDNTIMIEKQRDDNEKEKLKGTEKLAKLLKLEDDSEKDKKLSKLIKLEENEFVNTRNNTETIENQRDDGKKDKKPATKSYKLKDTELVNTKNNTLLIENQHNDNPKTGDVNKPDSKTQKVDTNTTAERNMSSDAIAPLLQVPQRNMTVAGEKRLNETVLTSGSLTETLSKPNENKTSDTNLNSIINGSSGGSKQNSSANNSKENSNISKTSNDFNEISNSSDSEDGSVVSMSSNESNTIIPQSETQGKNVSQHVRQRRVNATKLVINVVLDAVRKELLNRSIGPVQFNSTNPSTNEKESPMNIQRHNSSISSEILREGAIEIQPKNNAAVFKNSSTNVKNISLGVSSEINAKEANIQKDSDAKINETLVNHDSNGPGKNVSQHTRQRRVNATKLTINAVLDAVRKELFNRLEVENGLKSNSNSTLTKNESLNAEHLNNTSGAKLINSSAIQDSSPNVQHVDNAAAGNLDTNTNVIRNESFSIRNPNNDVIGNASIISSIKTFGTSTILSSQNSSIATDQASLNAPNTKTPAVDQVVWENELHNDEHAAKFKDVKLNVDPSAENLYGTQGVLQPIYDNYGDFYDRNEQIDYREDPVDYRVETEGGFARKHRDIPPRYWRG